MRPCKLALLFWMVTLAGCTTPATFPETSRRPTPTGVASTPQALPQATVLAPTPAVLPVQEATPGPKRDFLAAILGPAPLPDGWSVELCAAGSQALCFSAGGKQVGGLEMDLYTADEAPLFIARLEAAGLQPGPRNMQFPAKREVVAAALKALANDYIRTMAREREGTYPKGVTFLPVGPDGLKVGDLPGMLYGFWAVSIKGETVERVINFNASDGEAIYQFSASYGSGARYAFATAEDLKAIEPYLEKILAALNLPLPVQETPVKSVTARKDLVIYKLYGAGPPAGLLNLGKRAAVTGLGFDGVYWRIACPDQPERTCWIPADPALTQPSNLAAP